MCFLVSQGNSKVSHITLVPSKLDRNLNVDYFLTELTELTELTDILKGYNNEKENFRQNNFSCRTFDGL